MNVIRERHGTWIIAAPIANLALTEAVNYEFRIDRVTFIRRENLSRRRIRFGFPGRLSQSTGREPRIAGRFFESSETFATIRQTGVLAQMEAHVLELIRDECAILALSNLGYAASRPAIGPAIGSENPTRKRSHLALNADDGSWSQPNSTISDPLPLTLDAHWREFHRRSYFYQLLGILRGDVPVARAWRRDLRNAAILAGQSQASVDLPQAFLWNMIALELLLTTQADKGKISETLPARAEAFLGWIGFWNTDNFEDRIRALYSKRCEFVHSGRRESISPADVFFADDLLFNLLLNLVAHHQLFRSKDDIISFSKRVQAEHLLGIDTKVRPRTLRFMRRQRSTESYRR